MVTAFPDNEVMWKRPPLCLNCVVAWTSRDYITLLNAQCASLAAEGMKSSTTPLQAAQPVMLLQP
jgi:hypothetical protein